MAEVVLLEQTDDDTGDVVETLRLVTEEALTAVKSRLVALEGGTTAPPPSSGDPSPESYSSILSSLEIQPEYCNYLNGTHTALYFADLTWDVGAPIYVKMTFSIPNHASSTEVEMLIDGTGVVAPTYESYYFSTVPGSTHVVAIADSLADYGRLGFSFIAEASETPAYSPVITALEISEVEYS